MTLRPLLAHALDDPAAAALASGGGTAFVSPSLRAYLLAALLDGAAEPGPMLVVAGDDRAAQGLAVDLRAWLAPRPVRFYPSRGVAYESHLAPPPHLVGLRVAALDALLDSEGSGDAPVVVAGAAALSEKVPNPALRPHGFAISVGETVDLGRLGAKLVAAGYERVDQVDDRGQFAVRGGLLDVYPATEERAVRVDLFGDEIESLRWFSTFTQRSLGDAQTVEISPAAELDEDHRLAAELAALEDDADARPDVAELLPIDEFHALLDLLPAGTGAAIAAEEDVEPALNDLWQDVTAAFHDSDAHSLYVAPSDVRRALDGRAYLRLTSADRGDAGPPPLAGEGEHTVAFTTDAGGSTIPAFRAQAADTAARSLREAEPELEKLVRSGYRTVVTWARRGDGERAAFNLARSTPGWIEDGGEVERLSFAHARLRDGFVAAPFRLAVLPDHRLIRRRRAQPGRSRVGALRSFADLRTGDIVVHEDHGVGRFAGFETKTVANVTRDYLYLEYAGADRVFVPSDQLAKISRYVGAGGDDPPLSKLGGTRWEQMKARARRAAQELAGELLNLYAERKRRAGHAFEPDGEWQRDFEDAFPHTETPDQRDAIEQVKADMEAPRPMDRLICGDVGYGKTEVALRAAFKCAAEGKQTMMLVPTTILAQQHFGTFAERFRDWPLTVEHVSRFRPPREQKAAVKAFSEGTADVLIGTHRLLSRDVRAKDLGLLIVDEEQRFGVKQKELLRQLKLRVDVIAMSATPIPRTLQISLAGVRDLSTLETPPEGRRPVRTYVGEYDEELVKRALEREGERGGQAFFLHNRVETIDETAERLRGLCPGLRFAVAHGQLDESDLEQRMLGFVRGEADVLVCTSIIESGIDIPQANTLIVDRADVFGLAQLYQIRGRVGRSRDRAYSYLMYPSAAALTPEAAQRLAALSDYTELGAGVKIALRDLEIRGAGNLLGDEQSGHVAALGFELYLRMLDEAVASAGGDGDSDGPEPVRLDVNVDAYVPADFIPYEEAKIDVHRRIAGAREVADLEVLRAELADRFGELPSPLTNLIDLQRARIRLGEAGATAVTLRAGRLVATPIELEPAQASALTQAVPAAHYEPGRSQLTVAVPEDPALQFPAVVGVADALLAAIDGGRPAHGTSGEAPGEGDAEPVRAAAHGD